MKLTPLPPYNFLLVIEFLSHFPHPGTDIVTGDAYRRVLDVDDTLTLVEVHPSDDDSCLEVKALTGTLNDKVMAQLGHILSTTVDMGDFWTQAREDARLWSVVGALYGLPALCTPTVFEALANTIIEQQIAWRAARRAQRWLLEWADRSIEFEGQRYYAYPTPQQIASSSVEELKPLKITHRRITLLIDIAQQIASGKLNLEQIRDLSHDAAYDFLLEIKGVGHWTAAVTISRAMGRNTYIGDNDVALQAAANRYFLGGKGRIARQQVLDIFAPYGEHAGLAAFYTLARWVLDEY
ncbi:MAG: hypothetical protein L0154_16650 [Chloroflexi bacterium]|nr:hypothetical protein [Chloroflexota bacterium]